MKRRILVVIGTRPEAVKLAPVVRELRQADWADCRVLVTAQHRELLDRTLAFFGVEPDLDLDLMRPAQSPVDFTARCLAAVDPVLAAERPDLVVVEGDTTTVFAAALGAFYRRVPVAHVEAGLRTGDRGQPFPEEANRRLVAQLADLHFAPTAAARDNLLREGIATRGVHVVGNTGIDALQWAVARVDAGAFRPPPGRRRLLVTAHRRENLGAPLGGICAAIARLAARPDVDVLWPLHPNPEVRANVDRRLRGAANVHLRGPLDYPDMVAAMLASHVLLTDSGGVQEEGPALGKPVLVLRDDTERPEGVAAGVAQLVGTDPGRIVAAASRLLDDPGAHAAMARVVHPYGVGGSAAAIAAVLRAADLGGRSG
ncbi:MAG: UDP-N-acetylglucosamine 2-epimerase (non-hydrolyzing) [Planctomycetes bacterium]|nr:UDP-N-acetylglucosamine 2-epimerase (non-hydrolyzing) [Planctomycetota bacterium]